jgi:hypothetical protein
MRAESDELRQKANNKEDWTSVVKRVRVVRGWYSQGVSKDANNKIV